MAIIRSNEVRAMADSELAPKLAEVRTELSLERGKVKRGGKATNSGRIRELSKTVARMMTIMHEKKLGIARKIRERHRKGG